ncbi:MULTISPECIES: TraR/DksA family transcriptional regulator [Halomonadaceae]|uniref:TraR/DksA family transcriptional regulator n=1 Tax=Vreelandella alkaliphila TaxID=272774 RepID=A0AAJ2RXU8_9GAMM|nr:MULTISPECIES: TraR/DksA family transcriptional regulator [Halomonas]MCD6003522.1 TraR/DksA family transcriptional regulator [Halomonas sp. IOP_6]MCD6439923.1 TraR/DksA family transcriptional regulator [Halomonas sp.]MDX5976291.1 TraR/DksA family transcriptional regulator [Halomonas alkaliphila]
MAIQDSTRARKALLEGLRTELQERLQRYKEHQHRISGALEKDLEEQATQVQNDEVVDQLENEATSELTQIELALARIEAQLGDYCEECGGLIAPERLKALPYATRCKDCSIIYK